MTWFHVESINYPFTEGTPLHCSSYYSSYSSYGAAIIVAIVAVVATVVGFSVAPTTVYTILLTFPTSS